MAEHFPVTVPKELAKLLADKFVDCIIRFNNREWQPQLGGVSRVNFLKFQNGREIGTQGFMMSVAIESDLFLEGVRKTSIWYTKSSERKYNDFNKTGNMRVLNLNQFTTSIRKTAEILLKEKAILLPDSITIISTSRDGTKTFTGGNENYEQIKINTSIVSRETMDKESE